ncbi:hypothetical protein NKJ74_25925 [Mesorhizobium sp. M0046]|uniref:hypothetical protein n=1 Tax=Mesorhizobium sp. M0046 TaxID=2956858 RepID=UPI00333A4C27
MLDLIVTMDDATSTLYSAFLIEEEGTASSFQGLLETLVAKGLPSSLYTDRGSHYFVTLKAGEAVDKSRLTQVGRALRQLGIEHIPAYSPEARGRSERMFSTLQDRLPKELALAGIAGDCQEFCARGHDDGKERIITWLLRRNFWTNCLRVAIRMRFSPETGCSTI